MIDTKLLTQKSHLKLDLMELKIIISIKLLQK